MKAHPPKTNQLNIRMTDEERRMLRTMAVKSSAGSDQGFIRKLIRDAWARRLENLERRQSKALDCASSTTGKDTDT